MSACRVLLLVDLSFGDTGKGSVVDACVRRYGAHTVVRFNGGGQAAHNVITADGRHHTFAQFGSGMFAGASTHLSSFMLVQPWSMLAEASHLAELGVDAFERTTIDERALVVTPFHRAANQLREMQRGDQRHGSCGMGIGETASDALELPEDLIVRMGDLRDESLLRAKLDRVRLHKLEQMRACIATCREISEIENEIWDLESPDSILVWMKLLKPFLEQVRIVDHDYLARILSKPGCVIFEPAQGVLLDEWRGFHPHTTWSTCTLDQANALLEEAGFTGEVLRLGLVRAYATRHGPGPFPSFDAQLTELIPDQHNTTSRWQREFRVGYFDAVLTRYAIACVGKLDGIIITCLDRLRDVTMWKMVNQYEREQLTADTDFIETFEFLRLFSALRLGTFKDLTYQERLTRFLSRVTPLIETTTRAPDFETRVKEHVFRIEKELGLPAYILSLGSTADDKRFLRE